MAESRSPAEIGTAVVAGLISIAEQRQEVVEQLRTAVEAAVRELDPDGVRDHSGTWWDDHPWSRADGFVRFRKSFEDIEECEVQAKDITESLVSVLARRPTAVARHHPPTPVEAHRLLTILGRQRLEQIGRLQKALRSVRKGLSAGTATEVYRAIGEMRRAEERDGQYREKLGRLLSMGDLVDQAV